MHAFADGFSSVPAFTVLEPSDIGPTFKNAEVLAWEVTPGHFLFHLPVEPPF